MSNAQARPIDEVKIEGAQESYREVLKTLTGFLPGDNLEQVRLDRAMAKLKSYYESKGYPQAEISYDVQNASRVRLVFSVTSGEPVLIESVDFSFQYGELSPQHMTQLRKSIQFEAGELFDRDRVKEMKRSIESALGSMNYVDSRVADIRVLGGKSGVGLTFQVELGQRVIFSVYGNHHYTRTELMDLIEEQRAQGLGRDYITVIANRLQEFYVSHGFRNVNVKSYVFEPSVVGTERKVAFKIDEGERVWIRRVVIDGNQHFTQGELVDLFFKNASDRIQARIFNEKMIEEAAQSMVDEVRNQGFLSAKMIAIKNEILDDGSGMEVLLFLSEGLQTRVNDVEFSGNSVVSSEDLSEYLGIKEGDPLSLNQLENGLDRIRKEYRDLGFLNVAVTNENQNLVTYSEKNQYAALSIALSEGPLLKLAGYEIYGNAKTQDIVISREIQIEEGEALSEKKLLETEGRLRRLGVFSQVKLELVELDSGVEDFKKLKISVQEGSPGNIGGGIGFRNDLGVRVFGELSYANLWGLDHSWVFGLSGNRRLRNYRFAEFSARMSYIWPYFTLGETTFRPSLLAERRQYIQFNAETYSLSANFERVLYRPLGLSAQLTYAIEQIRQFSAVLSSENQRIRIGTVTPSIRVDLRDNSLAPRKGFYGVTSFEYATTLLGSQFSPAPISYGRLQVRTDYYFNLFPRLIWYTSVRGGWLKNFVSTYNADGTANPDVGIPLIKQFALGGINSLRGYVDQEINVQSTDSTRRVLNYSTYVNYRSQMDFLLSRNLAMGPFMDAGNLKVEDFSLGDLKYGGGVGMRYMTPVGPINFDWGFKLFSPGQDANVFYFSLGVI